MPLSAERLSCLKPVQGLSPARLDELASLCDARSFALGSDPLQELAAPAQFLYLLAGELKLDLPDGSMRLLVGGCDEALWPLGYMMGPSVRSKAVTDVLMLSLDFELLDLMMTWDGLSASANKLATPGMPDAAMSWDTLGGAFSARLLKGSGLAQLPPANIHSLLQRFENLPVRQGQIVIREGDAGDYFYLIESGRCAVTRRVGGTELALADLKAGDSFGEEALLSDARRNASVTMRTDGMLLRLAKPDFIALLQAPLLQTLDRSAAEARVADGALWLDVRYPAEFAEDGLPGAINLPLSEMRNAFDLLDKAREYIVYCQSGRRSSAAAFLLAQHGFKAFWLQNGLGSTEKT